MLAQSTSTKPESERYVHIFNIGIENRNIFNEPADYDAFVNYLKEYLSAPLHPDIVKTSFTVKGKTFKGTPHLPKNYHQQIHLVAYSLMPDHFHLLIKHTDKIALESFMRSLSTRYSMYFNKRYKRNGKLFRGAYKSVQLDTMPQLLYLTRYFHKENGVSSFPTYIDPSKEAWVSSIDILALFDNIKDKNRNDLRSYQSFVEEANVDSEQKLTISGLTLEETESLERSVPASLPLPLERKILSSGSPETHNIKNSSLSRIPAYSILTVWFVLLFTVGFLNVQINKTANKNSSDTYVLALTIDQTPSPSNSPINNEPVENIVADSSQSNLTPTPSPSPASLLEIPLTATASAEKKASKYSVRISIIEGTTLNIYQKPDSTSLIVTKATNNTSFEYVSTVEGWYEIKIDEFKNGFILDEFGILEQSTN